jgi:hypothetical protein
VDGEDFGTNDGVEGGVGRGSEEGGVGDEGFVLIGGDDGKAGLRESADVLRSGIGTLL